MTAPVLSHPRVGRDVSTVAAASRPPPGSTEKAVEQLGSADTPVLLRLRISHYCRKAEFALTRAAIPYKTLDVPLARMRQVRRANPVRRTVPLLVDGAALYNDSHAIVRWCDTHRRTDVPSFYPEPIAQEVMDFEHWTDKAIGPPVRHLAYRVLAKDPAAFGKNATARLRLRVQRPIFRLVADYLKVDETAQQDERSIEDAIEKIGGHLQKTGTGYLFTTHITAADLAVAGLMEPMLRFAHVWGYDEHEHWPQIVAFIKSVRPSPVRPIASRRIKEHDWQAFETLNQAEATLQRPTAAEYP